MQSNYAILSFTWLLHFLFCQLELDVVLAFFEDDTTVLLGVATGIDHTLVEAWLQYHGIYALFLSFLLNHSCTVLIFL